MLLNDKDSWRNSFHIFSLRDFCAVIQIWTYRVTYQDLTSFFLWKMLDIVLEYWKLSKLCFIIGKTFGLLGLYVIVKGIISSFFAVFGYVTISRGISLALNMLASISDLEYFCSINVFFSFLKRFSFTFSFSAMVHILLARKNGIFVKQCRRWFDVNGT